MLIIKCGPALSVVSGAVRQPVGAALGVVAADGLATNAIRVASGSRQTVRPGKAHCAVNGVVSASTECGNAY